MEDMVGTWRLESRDPTFNDFLICRQTRYFLRTIMTTFSADFEYTLSEDKLMLTKKTITSFNTSLYPMTTTGEFVPEKTLSGKPEVGRLFETSGRKVIQEMRYQSDDSVAAVMEHQVIDGKLHVKLKCENVVCNEIYNRIK